MAMALIRLLAVVDDTFVTGCFTTALFAMFISVVFGFEMVSVFFVAVLLVLLFAELVVFFVLLDDFEVLDFLDELLLLFLLVLDAVEPEPSSCT